MPMRANTIAYDFGIQPNFPGNHLHGLRDPQIARRAETLAVIIGEVA